MFKKKNYRKEILLEITLRNGIVRPLLEVTRRWSRKWKGGREARFCGRLLIFKGHFHIIVNALCVHFAS